MEAGEKRSSGEGEPLDPAGEMDLEVRNPGAGIPVGAGLLFYLAVGGAGLALPLVFGRWEKALALVRGQGPLFFQAGAGAGLGLVLVALSRLLAAKVKAMKELEEVLASLVGRLGFFRILVLALVSGPAEEMLFRCALMDLVGPVWSTLAFALCHTGPGKKFRAWTLMAGVVGALFAWMVLDGWGLAAVAAAHSTLNFLNLLYLSGRGKSP